MEEKKDQICENGQSNHPGDFTWDPSGAALGRKIEKPGNFMQPSLKCLVSLVTLDLVKEHKVPQPGESIS